MAGRRLSTLTARGLLLAALLPAAAVADDARPRPGAHGVAGVEALLSRLRAVQPGRLLRLELEQEDGGPVYEVKLLTDDGRVVELELDARSLELVGRRAGRHGRDEDDEHSD